MYYRVPEVIILVLYKCINLFLYKCSKYFKLLFVLLCRVPWCWETEPCAGCPLWGHPAWQDAQQLQREGARAHHVHVPWSLCRTQEESSGQGGTLPVPEHFSECKLQPPPSLPSHLWHVWISSLSFGILINTCSWFNEVIIAN